MLGVQRKAVLGVEALSKGVDRTGPDIAEHDAERREAQSGKPAGNIRLVSAALFRFGQRGVPRWDDLGCCRGVAGTVCHVVLLAAARPWYREERRARDCVIASWSPRSS